MKNAENEVLNKVTPTVGMSPATLMKKLTLLLQQSFAEGDSKRRSLRVKAGLAAKNKKTAKATALQTDGAITPSGKS